MYTDTWINVENMIYVQWFIIQILKEENYIFPCSTIQMKLRVLC